jgi:putative membrane protein
MDPILETDFSERATDMETPAPKFDVQPTASNHFAWMNTQMALQRTLMAASRTAIALIGFGFTVAQFFEKLIDKAPADLRHLRPETPRNLGLALIGAGVISLTVFTVQYHRASAYMRSGDFAAIAGFGKKPMHSATYIVSFTVIAIGLAAFASVFARL